VSKRYNHLYAVGFSVDSDHRDDATADEILHALLARWWEMRLTGEVHEAVGIPDETVVNETGETVLQE
jgi:hypothetical protein